MGWGKLNRKCQVSNRFFGGAPKSLTEEGRDTALQKKLTKKGPQKLECLNINYFYRLYINDVDFFIQ